MKHLEREGVRIAFTESGSGDPALVFVHGAMADHTHFEPQANHFSSAHRTLSVDLRGHGNSDKPEQEYTIEGFADDIVWLCGQLGVDKPIVVGHSMGGLIALDLAARFPSFPSAIVILDTPVIPPSWFKAAFAPFLAALSTPAYSEAIGQFLDNFIGFPDDERVREALIEKMKASSQHVTVSALTSYDGYDSATSAAACEVPVLYVSSGPWFADIDALRERCPQLVTGQTVGSGHYHQLETPGQINAMLERFIDLN